MSHRSAFHQAGALLPDGRMDTTQTARYLGVSVKTLAQWRWQGTGPRYVKPGRVYYYWYEVDAWVQAQGVRGGT